MGAGLLEETGLRTVRLNFVHGNAEHPLGNFSLHRLSSGSWYWSRSGSWKPGPTKPTAEDAMVDAQAEADRLVLACIEKASA